MVVVVVDRRGGASSRSDRIVRRSGCHRRVVARRDPAGRSRRRAAMRRRHRRRSAAARRRRAGVTVPIRAVPFPTSGARTTKRAPPPGRSSTHASPPSASAVLGDEREPETGADPVAGGAAASEALEDARRVRWRRRRARRPRRRSRPQRLRLARRLDRDPQSGRRRGCVALSSRLPRIRSKRTLSTCARRVAVRWTSIGRSP